MRRGGGRVVMMICDVEMAEEKRGVVGFLDEAGLSKFRRSRDCFVL